MQDWQSPAFVWAFYGYTVILFDYSISEHVPADQLHSSSGDPMGMVTIPVPAAAALCLSNFGAVANLL